MQKAFEAWAVSCGLEALRTGSVYHNLQTQIRWCVWQAATEQAARAVKARYMGDNNREDMEVLRCVEAIRAGS